VNDLASAIGKVRRTIDFWEIQIDIGHPEAYFKLRALVGELENLSLAEGYYLGLEVAIEK